MRAGAGKQKGGEFERKICVELSKWITGGKQQDVFWRSAMSGGRATVKQGLVRQAGDITAVAPEGHSLTNAFYLELKHLKKITLDSLLTGKGELITIWNKTLLESAKYDRIPVLIFRQNRWPICFCTTYRGIQKLQAHGSVCIKSPATGMHIIKFDDLILQEYNL